MSFIRNVFVSITAVAGFTTAANAQLTLGGSDEAKCHDFVIGCEGASLPEGVMRARYVYKSVKGASYGYDKDGAKQTVPLDVTATGTALVAEYGINDELSFQFLQKIVNSQSGTINEGNALEATSTARATAKTDVKTAICTLQSIPAAQCDAALAVTKPTAAQVQALNTALGSKGFVFNTDTAIGGTVDATVDAGTLAAVRAAEINGGKGLSDTEIGVIWAPKLPGPFTYAVAGGIRLPTGNRDLSVGENPTPTRQVYEAALRLNLDYMPVSFMRFNYQNQTEGMIAGTSHSYAGVSQKVTRKGLRNVGFLWAKFALRDIHPSLAMFGPKIGYDYDIDNEKYVDDVATGVRPQEMRMYAGLLVNFIEVNLPLQLELEYRKSNSGKNVAVATDEMIAQLKGFYKF